MEPTEALEIVRRDLKEIRESGQTSIDIQLLDNYLISVQTRAGESLAVKVLAAENQVAANQMQNEINLRSWQAVIDAGRRVVSSIILINGGAAVAVLSFIGAAAVKPEIGTLVSLLRLPLLDFGLGVLAGLITLALAYLGQAAYHTERESTGNWLQYASTLSGIFGVALFGLGLGNAYRAFSLFSVPGL